MKIDYQTKIEQYSLVSFNNMKYTFIICCLYTGFSHSLELEYETCKLKSCKAFLTSHHFVLHDEIVETS